MSKSTLKKTLKEMSKDDIIEMVVELYSKRKSAAEYLEFWMNPDLDSVLETYKNRISSVYFTKSGGTPRKSPAFGEAKKLVKEFKELVAEKDIWLDLQLFNVEMMRKWMSEKRDLKKTNLTRLTTEMGIVAELIEQSELTDLFDKRITTLSEGIASIERAVEDMPLIPKSHRRWFKW